MFSIIQAAGWPIWPLIACSIVALAIVIERFISLKTAKVAPPRLLDEVLSVTKTRSPAPMWLRSSKRTLHWGRFWPPDCVL